MQYKGLEVRNAPSLAQLTSIRLGGRALSEILVKSRAGLDSLAEAVKSLGGKPVVLGRGSNILAEDGELPLVLISLEKSLYPNLDEDSLKLLQEDRDVVNFEISAALPLPTLVSRLITNGWAGLYGLVGIPGSVGGAVAMNAGSFGMDIKGALRKVTLFSSKEGVVEKSADELDLGYRRFAVPGLDGPDDWFVVLKAAFECRKADKLALKKESDRFLMKKRSSQPVNALSAGCIFKNPPEGPAGKLLEDAGMKGKSVGGMSFSELHANFMINNGLGRSKEAFELIDKAREAVKRSCGAELETEVRIWTGQHRA